MASAHNSMRILAASAPIPKFVKHCSRPQREPANKRAAPGRILSRCPLSYRADASNRPGDVMITRRRLLAASGGLAALAASGSAGAATPILTVPTRRNGTMEIKRSGSQPTRGWEQQIDANYGCLCCTLGAAAHRPARRRAEVWIKAHADHVPRYLLAQTNAGVKRGWSHERFNFAGR
jgi:hypothetical protein